MAQNVDGMDLLFACVAARREKEESERAERDEKKRIKEERHKRISARVDPSPSPAVFHDASGSGSSSPSVGDILYRNGRYFIFAHPPLHCVTKAGEWDRNLNCPSAEEAPLTPSPVHGDLIAIPDSFVVGPGTPIPLSHWEGQSKLETPVLIASLCVNFDEIALVEFEEYATTNYLYTFTDRGVEYGLVVDTDEWEPRGVQRIYRTSHRDSYSYDHLDQYPAFDHDTHVYRI